MFRRLFLWIVTAIVALAPLRAWADPITIGSFDGEFGISIPNNGVGQFTLRVFPGGIGLFGIPITTSVIGRTFLADASTEPDFGAFAAVVTNGRSDTVEIAFGPRDGGGPALLFGTSESRIFNLPASVVDFRGFMLTGVAFRVDDFSARSLPSGLALFELNSSLAIFGSGSFNIAPTPEPATLTLFVTGALRPLGCGDGDG